MESKVSIYVQTMKAWGPSRKTRS